MNEYKENTVGWWLSQLKEPLRSKAINMGHASLGEYSPSLKEAVEHVYELGEYGEVDEPFWIGVQKAFSRMQPVYGNLFLGDKGWEGYNMARDCAPDNWLKPKDGGEDKAIVDSPAPKAFEGFNKGMNSHVQLEPLPEGVYVDAPNISAIRHNKLGRDSYTITSPAREIEAPEPAVVGYEIPKPIDTIEKKHELRIQALEARVKQLEDHLWNYLGIKCK